MSVRHIGLMSGTSLDGIDAVLADFGASPPRLLHTRYLPYSPELRERLLALARPGDDELHRAAVLGNELSHLYSQAVTDLLSECGLQPQAVAAIGCHGQTVRHCPEPGRRYTIQLCNAALLAELTGITVVADFRSRDVAAGGQGAPLVPAFHHALFAHPEIHRTIINIGGIANLTGLASDGGVSGFDCGPGNLLMDAWCLRHTGRPYDEGGAWAKSGRILPELLDALLAHPFLSLRPPKSTGREAFGPAWLARHLSGNEAPADVQATLLQLTVTAIVQAVQADFPDTREIYLCGGGVHNRALVERLRSALPGRPVEPTDRLGIDADWVEAFAFAWLARQILLKIPAGLPGVTGARGARLLGAIYPA
ncbi:anhydro-N-acetylmuramic acid kinase [Nitrosovibrio sp. Nv17]|uniref:anhydro-N-acetylmuramic acid kinase n=1 Tax=Nitrosovibrio sp. Nv17 TaxID=1855339 RepID=UPI0009F9F5A5|nr:anhydro-N-acetylmuramic acid kinase [Nitrosovibrio sp. Nv17]